VNMNKRKPSIASIRAVFRKHLGHYVEDPKVIDKSVWKGDPYGWSGGTPIATLTSEEGMPGPYHYDEGPIFDAWHGPIMGELSNLGLYWEPINGAVTALWEG